MLAQLPDSGPTLAGAPLQSGPGEGHFIWMALGIKIHWYCDRGQNWSGPSREEARPLTEEETSTQCSN